MHRIALFLTLLTAALLCAPAAIAQKSEGAPMTIVIDPGHGGYDPGAIGVLNGKRYRECDINLKVALKLGKLINDNMPQVKVIYTRTTDKHFSDAKDQRQRKNEDLLARTKIANDADAELFLSIHCNWTRSSSACGAITLILGEGSERRNQQKEGMIEDEYREELADLSEADMAAFKAYCKTIKYTLLENCRSFANLLQKHHKDAVGHGNRKELIHSDMYAVLFHTRMPGALTEIGFLSNQHDLKIMASDSGQDRIARSIYEAFREYYDIYYGEKSAVETAPAEQRPEADGEAEDNARERTEEAGQQSEARIGYTIQLCASVKRIALGSSEFKSYRNKVREFRTSGTYKYKYCTGVYATKAEAEKALQQVRKSFRNAYIVGFEGEKLLSQSETASKLKK